MSETVDPVALVGGTLGGRYLLTDLMHRGMDTIFAATDTTLDRAVVVKVVTRAPDASADVQRAFQREARALARLYGETVCRVLDYDVSGADDVAPGLPYLVMERVGGEPLAARLSREGPMTPHAAFGVIEAVGKALTEAHGEHVVHADVRPANVFVERVGGRSPTIKLIDFEIALTDRRMGDRVEAHRADPRFMAPELSTREEGRMDARTDVYGLALLAWVLLAGRPPFEGDSPHRVLLGQLREKPPPLPGPADAPLARALDVVLRQGLAKAPAERWAEVSSMVTAISAAIYQSGDAAYRLLDPPTGGTPVEPAPAAPEAPPAARSRLPWVIGTLGLLAAAAGLVYWWVFVRASG